MQLDVQAQYAVTMFFRRATPEMITDWIEGPPLLAPHLVGVGPIDVVDRQTNRDAVSLRLAVWRSPAPLLGNWPVEVTLPDKALWLLTTWSRDPGCQHLLTALAVTDRLEALLGLWPAASSAIPLDSTWLSPEEKSTLVLAVSQQDFSA